MEHVWTVILAGGAGRRMADVTGGVPKQFWRQADHAPSFLENTVARLSAVTPPERTILVVNRAHRAHLSRLNGLRGQAVYQPADRGTATGLLFGLMPVLDRDPGAIVVVSPSDHGITNVEAFRTGLRQAVDYVRRGLDGIVLFAATPTSPEESYGWIVPGRPLSGGFREVRTFVEKPDNAAASSLLAAGAVWNTLVMVARATALINLFRRYQPDLRRRIMRAWRAPGGGDQLGDAYAGFTSTDLSRDVLQLAGHLAVSTWPRSLGWSDLGTPVRLSAWLRDRSAVPA